MKHLAMFPLLVLGLSLWAGAQTRGGKREMPFVRQAQVGKAFSVSWEPSGLVNGSACLFRVKPAQALRALHGKWLGRQIFFDFDASTGTWYGLAGVGLDTAAGTYQLALNATALNGAHVSSSHSVQVGKAIYRTDRLSVPRKFTEPDAEMRVRIRQEQALKREAFRRVTAMRLWQGRFVPAINSVTTGEFGERRTFNGKVQSVHQGLDFRAEVGTPVSALNSGRVLLAHEMFYEGGFVVLDHGYGWLTLYMHLSALKVKAGDRVAKQQTIALSGESGRSTSAHLHVGVRWQGLYIDPAILLNLQLP